MPACPYRAFEASFRESTAIAQFQAGVVDTSFSLPSETARIETLRSQRRTVDIVRFDLARAMEEVEVSDEDIQAWYDENADNYQFPQRAKIDYILLDSSELAEAIDVSDEEARAYYEDNRARYTTAELREASHILLSMDDPDDGAELAEKSAALEAVKRRLEAGETFADLAKGSVGRCRISRGRWQSRCDQSGADGARVRGSRVRTRWGRRCQRCSENRFRCASHSRRCHQARVGQEFRGGPG